MTEREKMLIAEVGRLEVLQQLSNQIIESLISENQRMQRSLEALSGEPAKELPPGAERWLKRRGVR